MNTVTVSPKYQIVIPKAIRERLGVKPGQRMRAMIWGKTLTFVPQRSLEDVQALFAGLENDFVRDKSDRDIG